MAKILLKRADLWSRHIYNKREVYFKGYILNNGKSITGIEASLLMFKLIPSLDSDNFSNQVKLILLKVDGMFAIIIKQGGRVFGAVDRNRSTPLLYCHNKSEFVIGDNGSQVSKELQKKYIDSDRCIEFSMSGFTIGNGTLYSKLYQLRAGEYIFVTDKSSKIDRYYIYSPWKSNFNKDEEYYAKKLSEVNTRLFSKLSKELNGRTVIVPLSAGLDSRLIVSGLVEAGYLNIKCYSYGLKGNFESKAAYEISSKLNIPWRMVETNHSYLRSIHSSKDMKKYFNEFDTYASVPTTQDFWAIHALKEDGWIPKDSVIINGNSGDFISGGHIPLSLANNKTENAKELNQLFELFIEKHYGLWSDLKNKNNINIIKKQLKNTWKLSSNNDPNIPLWSIYECLEWQSRQTNFILTIQRIYEFFGYSWRLPLWDKDYLDFWETVPQEYKYNQSLYRKVLYSDNWGGVWRKYDEHISPKWIAPVRNTCKLLCSPFGRKSWHYVDKHFFSYFMDIVGSASSYGVPYKDFLFDNRGFKNGISFRCKKYLDEKKCNAVNN